MTKRKYNFGLKYMSKLRVGIAVIQGEQSYWITDGYCRWKITAFDPKVGSSSVRFALWPRND